MQQDLLQRSPRRSGRRSEPVMQLLREAPDVRDLEDAAIPRPDRESPERSRAKGIGNGTQIEKFFTEAHRRSYDQGEAKALLMILKRRGLVITDEQQRQIATCTDLATLDRWLDRALSVTSVDVSIIARSSRVTGVDPHPLGDIDLAKARWRC